MKTYNCLVIDDERLGQELITTYIKNIPNLNIVSCCFTAFEAMPFLSKGDIDILFLDIQMPGFSGIDFFKSLTNPPVTILTTAYSEYAIEGFDLGVVDYLLKPIEFARFFKATSRAINRLCKEGSSVKTEILEKSANPNEDYFFVNADKKIVRIHFDDILYIEALQKYIRIYTAQKQIITLLSLSKIQGLLPPTKFVRIHRSFIINIDKIDSIDGNRVMIKDHEIPISKGQKEIFMNLLKDKRWM